MTQKLNSFKTYKDNWIYLVIWMILAYCLMLLPLCWGNYQAESETETAWTAENEFPFAIETNNKFCEEEIKQELRNIQNWSQSIEWASWLMLNWWCDYEYEWLKRAEESRNTDRYPWKLTEDWTQQEMPVVNKYNGSHQAFIELAKSYWLDPSIIWKVEDHYRLTEWTILCITVAETSWGNRWYGEKNIGSVGSNDRWDRPTYALMESWLEAIGKTLTNRYLWKVQTLGCLSNAGSCASRDDRWYRYATSESSWEKNMTSCLSVIYWKIDPTTFNIRER